MYLKILLRKVDKKAFWSFEGFTICLFLEETTTRWYLSFSPFKYPSKNKQAICFVEGNNTIEFVILFFLQSPLLLVILVVLV